jgi:hypothetical protein
MTLALLKFSFCAILSSGSIILYYFTKNKPWRKRLYIPLVCLGYLARFGAVFIIYSSKLSFQLTSDASNYYLPQAMDFISGKIPYYDFESSYSILFLPLISIPLLIWKSVGSIVVTMTLMDGAALGTYLWFCQKAKFSKSWDVALLYTYCPISLYWISIVGHNGSIIALGLMISFILAQHGKHYYSGVSAALGFLFCKLLAILFWPAIIFYANDGRIKRAAPMAAAIACLSMAMLWGINCISPVSNEIGNYTSGNIWFFISRFIPGFMGSIMWNILPVLTFSITFLLLFKIYLNNSDNIISHKFDSTVAFAAMTNLFFLILSKKSNTFYLTMSLLPMIHVLLKHERGLPWKLLSLAYIGSITTIEMYLWHSPSFSENVLGSYRGIIFIGMELLLIGSYLYLAVTCLKAISPINNLRPVAFDKATTVQTQPVKLSPEIPA